MLKNRRKISIGIIFALVLSMVNPAAATTASAETAPKESTAAVTDQVSISIDGGSAQAMQLYYNGLYEATGDMNEGTHTYDLYCNGSKLESKTVEVTSGGAVNIQYRPFKKEQLIDSVNNKDLFLSPAGWVGNLAEKGLGAYLQPELKDNWAPGSSAGFLDYMGGGIYKKTFAFKEALPKDITVDYKIAFGGDWNHGSIGKDGGNIPLTVPAGTSSITLWADSANMVGFDSITGTPISIHQNDASRYTKPAGQAVISLVGDMNDWNGSKDTFMQIGESLYAYTKNIAAGDYKYKCKIDDKWFENGNDIILNLNEDTIVTFIYNAETDKLFDNFNEADAVSTILNFTAPVDVAALDKEAYDGSDLGAVYTKDQTTFKVWAPTASMVSLNLYEGGDSADGSAPISSEEMTKSEKGIWSLTKAGDLKGKFYTYSVKIGNKTNETVDIYATAVGISGNRGMVVDLQDTDPENWEADRHVMQKAITDSVIWEVHVKDFSSNENSGISAANRGKYLAFTEKGTTLNGEGKIKTGIDHLNDLGVNYVHLLPVFDSANDEKTDAFNWGYNPKNYNVPEGSYSSNPADGTTRIKEFKQMVQGFHGAGIGVVMDVVYNHTAGTKDSWFNLTVPDYYYRHNADGTFANGSACGNETASERAMYRKYMVDSILYWAKEYHVDGFRFDLMALHDVDTMNAIRAALDANGLKDIILYGEPWTGGTSPLGETGLPANKDNLKLLNGIASFNDDIRDGAKGHVFGEKSVSFIQGGNKETVDMAADPREYSDEDLMAGIQANTNADLAKASNHAKKAWAPNPSQTISYVSAHDNLSLWDKLVTSTMSGTPEKSDYVSRNESLVNMNKIAAAIVITSQGTPFFQAGEEFARTKFGDENSYESSILVNQIDWSRLETFRDLNEYYKGLLQIRKKYDPFRDMTNSTNHTMVFSDDKKANLIAYTVQNTAKESGEWDTVAVILNSSKNEQKVELQTKTALSSSQWVVIANQAQAGTTSLGVINGNSITVAPQSVMILVDDKSFNGTSTGTGGSTTTPDVPSVPGGSAEKPDDTKDQTPTSDVPSIAGKEGWDEIENEIKNVVSKTEETKKSTTVSIDMKTTDTIPVSVLKTVASQNVKLKLRMDGYTWMIDGNSVNQKGLNSLKKGQDTIDLSIAEVQFDNTIKNIKEAVKATAIKNIKVNYDGKLPFEAEIMLNLGKSKAGKTVYLSNYNMSAKKAVTCAYGKADSVGDVTLLIPSGGFYTITAVNPNPPAAAAKKTVANGKSTYMAPKNILNGDKVTYKSSSKSILTVSSNGKITAKKSGKAAVTATVTQAGKKYTIVTQVTVK